MELTRRDALVALSATASGAVAGCSAPTDEYGDGPDPNAPQLDDQELATLVSLADVLYPSDTENVAAFVEAYATERVHREPAHGRGVIAAIGSLNDYAATIYGERFAALSASEREEALEEMPVGTVDPVPDGTEPQQVRYFLVNDLLYAFYATPTGASLAGLENPPGYPGGTASYQRGPQ
jgi:hypothetical protein